MLNFYSNCSSNPFILDYQIKKQPISKADIHTSLYIILYIYNFWGHVTVWHSSTSNQWSSTLVWGHWVETYKEPFMLNKLKIKSQVVVALDIAYLEPDNQKFQQQWLLYGFLRPLIVWPVQSLRLELQDYHQAKYCSTLYLYVWSWENSHGASRPVLLQLPIWYSSVHPSLADQIYLYNRLWNIVSIRK